MTNTPFFSASFSAAISSAFRFCELRSVEPIERGGSSTAHSEMERVFSWLCRAIFLLPETLSKVVRVGCRSGDDIRFINNRSMVLYSIGFVNFFNRIKNGSIEGFFIKFRHRMSEFYKH